MPDKSPSRRQFLKRAASSALIASAAPSVAFSADRTETLRRRPDPPVSPNDRINIATIGMGIIGHVDTGTALQLPGIQLVAAADCYDSRLVHAKEAFGQDVATTRDYREVLDRSDVDAVLVCTPDHWHAQIARDAMRAGKDVYLEKPMVHDLEEGPRVIQAQQETGRLLEVGSQRVSSMIYAKAKELYEDGAIGQLNMVQARYNRNSSIGAWQYSIPPNVTEDDLAWERFLGPAPDRPFDPKRFFRWRNYWDYGTGIPGDLFVHLYSGIHYVLGANGPTEVMCTGGLRKWMDGREVPDIQLGLYEYPETDSHPDFTLSLQVNFADGSRGGQVFQFVGDEGVMRIDGGSVTVARRAPRERSLESLVNGYNSVRTFSEAVQQEFIDEYEAPESTSDQPGMDASSEYVAPDDYNDRLDHFKNFFAAMRTGQPVVEDAVFGYRAAAPALLTNLSYRNDRIYQWDPEAMEVVS